MPLKSDSDSEKKVMDALACRMDSESEAGWKLMESSPFVLPAIEKVILDTLEPESVRGGDMRDRHPGLDFVFCAYFIIQYKEEKLGRAVDFLRARSPKLIVSAICSIPTFFRVADFGIGDSDGALLGVAPASELREFVKELTRHEEPDLRYTAEKILRMTDWPK